MKSEKIVSGVIGIKMSKSDKCISCARVYPVTCPVIAMANQVKMSISINSCGFYIERVGALKGIQPLSFGIIIEVNGKPFRIHGTAVSEVSLRRLAGITDGEGDIYAVSEMLNGIPQDDVRVTGNVPIHEGDKFRTSPKGHGG